MPPNLSRCLLVLLPAGRARFRWSSLSRPAELAEADRPPVENPDATTPTCSTVFFMRSASTLAALALAAAVLLTGCVPQDPEVAPPPEPTTEPVFASDEEALAAATDAYKAYQAVLNEISRDGGSDPDRIASVVTADRLDIEIQGFSDLAESGRRLIGEPVVAQTTFQQLYMDASGTTTVVIYACLDPSDARIIDSVGNDVTPVQLQKPWPREATFQTSTPGDANLILADEAAWEGEALC